MLLDAVLARAQRVSAKPHKGSLDNWQNGLEAV